MAIAELSLVNITGLVSGIDAVTAYCMQSGIFHPDSSEEKGSFKPKERLPILSYSSMLETVCNAAAQLGLKPKYIDDYIKAASGTSPLYQPFEEEYAAFSNGILAKINEAQEQIKKLEAEKEQNLTVLAQIKHIMEMGIDFDDIFNCKYVRVRFGYLPTDSVKKLNAHSDKLFFFVPFETENKNCWGAYFTVSGYSQEVDEIFDSLLFNRIWVPEFVHGTPEAAASALETEIARLENEVTGINKRLLAFASENEQQINRLYTYLKFFEDSVPIRKHISLIEMSTEDSFTLSGFVPSDLAQEFIDGLMKIDLVVAEIRPPDFNKRISPPTKLKNGWFAKPFEMFIEMYGLPEYNDIDPTVFFAFTYSLLFGIMFGDLGQGLLLCAVGAFMWFKMGMTLGRVISRIGISSSVFGIFYGSVFGFEDLLTPVYKTVFGLPGKPIEVMLPENTNVILVAAAGLGVLLICTSILLDIYIGVRKGDIERAVFSANGIAGLMFYGGVLFGAVMLLATGKNLFNLGYNLTFIIIPLALIMLKEPLGNLIRTGKFRIEEGVGVGEFITEGFFELFDVILAFFSNTMSFLRVGGFVLSHAGMMAVVMTLSDMINSGGGSVLVIIFGNIFVVCMEGLIVGIQALRLEFYEMFSRFFDGGGRPFTPVHKTEIK